MFEIIGQVATAAAVAGGLYLAYKKGWLKWVFDKAVAAWKARGAK